MSLSEIDALGVLAREFSVEARGVGSVGDEPVEPAHVVLDHIHQPAARRLVLGDLQGLDRAASEVSGFFSSCATSAAKL